MSMIVKMMMNNDMYVGKKFHHLASFLLCWWDNDGDDCEDDGDICVANVGRGTPYMCLCIC